MAGRVQGLALFLVEYLTPSVIAEGSVFVNHAPQSATYPFIIATVVSREPSPTQDSGSAVDTYRVQLDVYAKATASVSAFDAAETIAHNARVAISRTYGIAMVWDSFTKSVVIDGVQEDNSFSEYIEDIMVCRVSTDYMIRVK